MANSVEDSGDSVQSPVLGGASSQCAAAPLRMQCAEAPILEEVPLRRSRRDAAVCALERIQGWFKY